MLIKEKKHFTRKGVQEILDLLSRMNTKRSFEDKYNYCAANIDLNLDPS